MSIQKCTYIGSDPKFAKGIFKTALWDYFDIKNGTVKLQFDDLALGTLAHNWHEVPLQDVVIEFQRFEDDQN